MSKRIERPAASRHIQIYEDDWNFLNDNFGRGTEKPLGASKAIRLIVHRYCNAVRQSQIKSIDEIGPGLLKAAEGMGARLRQGDTSDGWGGER